jgi:hypothetical protein
MSIFRVTFTGIRWSSVIMQNCIHFSSDPDPMTDDQVHLELVNNWLQVLRPLQSNTFIWNSLSVLRPGTNFTPSTFPISVQGTDAVDNQSGTCVTNLKIRILTAFAGKKGRGRFYLPAIRDQWFLNGLVQQQALTAFQPAINTLKARYVGVGAAGPLQVGVMGRGPEAEFHAAENLVMSNVPGIQRRRNIGIGI